MHHQFEQSLAQLRGPVSIARTAAVRRGVRFRDPRVVRLDRKHREEPVAGRLHRRPEFRVPAPVRDGDARVDAAFGMRHVRGGQPAPEVAAHAAAWSVDRRPASLAPAVARQPQAFRVRPKQDLEEGRLEMLAAISGGHPAKGLFLLVASAQLQRRDRGGQGEAPSSPPLRLRARSTWCGRCPCRFEHRRERILPCSEDSRS